MNELGKILINIGYDDITEPNLNKYNIEPEWNLKNKTNITTLLDNTLGNFKENSVDFFIKKNSNFIYPIILFDNKLFHENETIDLNEKVQLSIKLKKCKIVFVYVLEGYFNKLCVNWVNQFCLKYNFSKEDVIVITANLIEFSNNNFTVINYNYFGNHINFLNLSKLNTVGVEFYTNQYNKFLNNTFEFHFLCFNGIPRENRILMFNELNYNENFRNKSITTLRGIDKNYYYDVKNWDNQKIGGGARLNVDAHKKSFLNIVTETMYNTESIFISEKTYKPIYLCQPFIVFGNPLTLKKLHHLGYRTFCDWWDESYDCEIDFRERFNKIVIEMEKISKISLNELERLKKEMHPVLIHNYLNFFRINEIENLFKLIQCGLNNQTVI
jgi:hypothetical protein